MWAWVRVVSSVQDALTVDRAGRTSTPCRDTRSWVRVSTTDRPILMISPTRPGGGCPDQQVASTSTTSRNRCGASVSRATR